MVFSGARPGHISQNRTASGPCAGPPIRNMFRNLPESGRGCDFSCLGSTAISRAPAERGDVPSAKGPLVRSHLKLVRKCGLAVQRHHGSSGHQDGRGRRTKGNEAETETLRLRDTISRSYSCLRLQGTAGQRPLPKTVLDHNIGHRICAGNALERHGSEADASSKPNTGRPCLSQEVLARFGDIPRPPSSPEARLH